MRWLPRTTGVLLVLGLAACRARPQAWAVEAVQISGEAAEVGAAVGLNRDGLRAEVTGALRGQRAFRIPDTAGEAPKKGTPAVRIELTALEIDDRAPDPNAPLVQAAVVLDARRREHNLDRLETEGLGKATPAGSGLEDQKHAAREALKQALGAAAVALALRLEATGRKDGELVGDLKHAEPARREAALATLVERHAPAAVDPLIERLSSGNPLVVRRAIGGLVELRATRAVPAMIELARQREPIALRELIYALGSIGGEEAEAFLYTVAQGHDQPAIQEVAQQALSEMSARTAREDSGTPRAEREKAP